MIPTQEQIDELVRAATVIADGGFPVSEALFSDYSALTAALVPFVKPKTKDLIARLRRTYPNDSERTELGRAAADLIEELQNRAWNK